MKKQILIIDDNHSTLEICKALLESSMDIIVVPAQSLREGLELARNNIFSLYLTDKNLEPGSGFDFIRSVREEAALADIPIVMMSGESDIDSIMMAKNLGVARFITKPFRLTSLAESIQAVLNDE